MDFSKGYTSTYYMTVVDPATWRDIARYELTGGDVERTDEGLRQSASIDCRKIPEGIENYVRIYLDPTQNGSTSHNAIFTGLATCPGRKFSGNISQKSLSCFSVLKPCEDEVLPRGWYANRGRPGGDVIRELLEYTPAPAEVASDSPTLADFIIAEDQETAASMIDKVLDAIGWTLTISGAGIITVGPKPTSAAVVFDPRTNDVIETELEVEEDLFTVPNCVRITAGEETAEFIDEDADSELSVVNRGRRVWYVDDSANLSSSESAETYARRILKEQQQVAKTASYRRRYIPDLYPGQYVELHYPDQGLTGVFKIEEQKIGLEFAARTEEKVTKWQN